MTGPVALAQGMSAAAWAIVMLYSAREAVHLFHRPSPENAYGFLRFAMALTQVGFVARWYIWPGAVRVMAEDETSWWIALYLMSSAVAGGYTIATIARWGWRPWKA